MIDPIKINLSVRVEGPDITNTMVHIIEEHFIEDLVSCLKDRELNPRLTAISDLLKNDQLIIVKENRNG